MVGSWNTFFVSFWEKRPLFWGTFVSFRECNAERFPFFSSRHTYLQSGCESFLQFSVDEKPEIQKWPLTSTFWVVRFRGGRCFSGKKRMMEWNLKNEANRNGRFLVEIMHFFEAPIIAFCSLCIYQ